MDDNLKKNGEFYHESFDVFRFIVLISTIIFHFGLPGSFDITRYAFGFSVPAVFLVSGYLVSGRTEEFHKRIERTLKRSFIAFVVLTALYFIFSYIVSPDSTLNAIGSKDFWVGFIVFNQWSLPPSVMLWYVQAFFYAYLIIFILDKLHLLKFDLVIAIILLVFSLLSGELSGLIKFSVLGRKYIASNFITMALPFILIGGYIRRNKKLLLNVHGIVFKVLAVVGLALTYFEYAAYLVNDKLIYNGRFAGSALMAVSICCWLFKYGEMRGVKGFSRLNRWDFNAVYYVFPFIDYIFTYILKFGALSLFLALLASFVAIPLRHFFKYLRSVILWKIKKKKSRHH